MNSRPQRRVAERFGRHAETFCVWWLRLRGYRVLARRFVAGVGEIDIVARRGSLLAVVEVKARADFQNGESPLTSRQRGRIHRAAEVFLARFPRFANHDVRFDLMLVRPWRVPRHLTDAWRP